MIPDDRQSLGQHIVEGIIIEIGSASSDQTRKARKKTAHQILLVSTLALSQPMSVQYCLAISRMHHTSAKY